MSNHIKSPFKYAGGKGRILDRVLELIHNGRESVGEFVEPFFGSGVVGINVKANTYKFSDLNDDVVNAHNQISKDPQKVIEKCELLWDIGYDKDGYNHLRQKFRDLTPFNDNDRNYKAALLVYLNRFGFNGMIRYSKNGYNVPVGKPSKEGGIPEIPSDAMKVFSSNTFMLTRGNLVKYMDFASAMEHAKDGSTIYCDPPYVKYTDSKSEIQYSEKGFGDNMQRLLANKAEICRQRGCRVLISNHDTPYTRKLYKDADEIVSFEVQRSISCKGGNRIKVRELIAIYDKYHIKTGEYNA